MTAVRYESADGFEYDTEPDSGVFLYTGKEWEGLRVKYRIHGARRWVRFIFIDGTPETVLIAVKEHARSRGWQVSAIALDNGAERSPSAELTELEPVPRRRGGGGAA